MRSLKHDHVQQDQVSGEDSSRIWAEEVKSKKVITPIDENFPTSMYFLYSIVIQSDKCGKFSGIWGRGLWVNNKEEIDNE